MANLMDLLKGQLTDDVIGQMAQQLGADKQQTATAAEGALASLMAALNKNASSPDGANALAGALDRDHDGSVLEDIFGTMKGAVDPGVTTNSLNAGGILKHVLGGNQGNIIDMISKMSGLASGKSGNLLMMLAPLVLGQLGKQKRSNNLDTGGLSDLLSKTVQSQTSQNSQMGMIGKLLDRDGDGSVIDDLADLGKNVLGNLFKK